MISGTNQQSLYCIVGDYKQEVNRLPGSKGVYHRACTGFECLPSATVVTQLNQVTLIGDKILLWKHSWASDLILGPLLACCQEKSWKCTSVAKPSWWQWLISHAVRGSHVRHHAPIIIFPLLLHTLANSEIIFPNWPPHLFQTSCLTPLPLSKSASIINQRDSKFDLPINITQG